MTALSRSFSLSLSRSSNSPSLFRACGEEKIRGLRRNRAEKRGREAGRAGQIEER